MELAIAYIILIITILFLVFSNKRSLYDRGYSFAQDIFEENNMRRSVKIINHILTGYDKHTRDNFKTGIRRCLNDKLSAQIETLNNEYGGDWYFDEDKMYFKDSLTSRFKIL